MSEESKTIAGEKARKFLTNRVRVQAAGFFLLFNSYS